MDHPTADEVLAAVVADETSVSRATVFNVLADPAENGPVMRADAGPGATRYEAATSFHHHFVCKQCGSVADVPCADAESLCLDPGGVAGRVDDAQITFCGIYEVCLDDDR